MIYFTIYLLDTYISFKTFVIAFTVLTLVSLLAGTIGTMIYYTDYKRCDKKPELLNEYLWQSDYNSYKIASRITQTANKILFVALPLALLLPSKNAMYAMTAVYFGQSTIENTTKHPMFDKAYKIMEQKIDEYLAETTKGYTKK